MTSAISLTKYMKLQVKERSWLIILIGLVSFLAQPVYLLLTLQTATWNYGQASPDAAMMTAACGEAVNTALGLGNIFIAFCVVVAALLAAFSCFTWLYQKEKSDFMLGLAMDRPRQFRTMALTGILAAVVPYVIAVLLSLFVICPIYGVLSAALIATAFKTLGWWILGFLAIYFTVIAALLLTGRYLPGVLLAFFILGFGPCLVELFEMLIESSFTTYYTSFAARIGLAWYLSPLTLLFSFAAGSAGAAYKIAVMAIIAVAACLVSRTLFVKRPAETAGASLTYPGIMSLLKVIVTVPCAVVSGMFLESVGVGNTQAVGWMIFGGVIGAVIVGGIMEFIESYDLKMIVRHWKSGLIAVIGALAVLLIFRYDPFGYDRFLPSEDKIEAMAVSEDTYLNAFGAYYRPAVTTDRGYSEIDLLERSLTDDFDSLYGLAEKGTAFAAELRQRRDALPTEEYQEEDHELRTEVIIMYKMKSGRRILRSYTIPVEDLDAAVRELAGREAYKEALSPAAHLDTESFDMIACTGYEFTDGSQSFVKLTADERAALKEALLSDTAAVTTDRLFEEEPLAVIHFITSRTDAVTGELVTESVPGGAFGSLSGMEELYLYPSYEKTTAVLAAKGLHFNPKAAAAQVVSLEVTIDRSSKGADGTYYYNPEIYRITDPEAIAQICAMSRRVRDTEPYQVGECANVYYTLSTGAQNGYTIKVSDMEQLTAILAEKGLRVEESEEDRFGRG